MLNDYAVLVRVFRQDDFNTAKWLACGRDTMATVQLTDIRDLPVDGPLGSSKRKTQHVFSRPLVQSCRSRP
jgi:hypothetical protein